MRKSSCLHESEQMGTVCMRIRHHNNVGKSGNLLSCTGIWPNNNGLDARTE
jgi:hypothetical protein